VVETSSDVGFAQRVKALACTAPLHDLDNRKTQVQAGNFSVYQMSELALNAIDLVTLAMDFDAGASPEQIVTDLSVYVLVGALEIDIESTQIAADLRLETLIRRGRLSDAQAAAQSARYRPPTASTPLLPPADALARSRGLARGAADAGRRHPHSWSRRRRWPHPGPRRPTGSSRSTSMRRPESRGTGPSPATRRRR